MFSAVFILYNIIIAHNYNNSDIVTIVTISVGTAKSLAVRYYTHTGIVKCEVYHQSLIEEKSFDVVYFTHQWTAVHAIVSMCRLLALSFQHCHTLEMVAVFIFSPISHLDSV